MNFKRKDIPITDTHCLLVDIQYSYIRYFISTKIMTDNDIEYNQRRSIKEI